MINERTYINISKREKHLFLMKNKEYVELYEKHIELEKEIKYIEEKLKKIEQRIKIKVL